MRKTDPNRPEQKGKEANARPHSVALLAACARCAVTALILSCGALLLFINVMLASQPAASSVGDSGSRPSRIARGAFPRALALLRSLQLAPATAAKAGAAAASAGLKAQDGSTPYRFMDASYEFNPAASAVSRFAPLSFPRCDELYRDELWSDSYFVQTRAELREQRGAAAAGEPEPYLNRMYEPALNVRVDRNETALGGRVLRNDAEIAALTSPFLFTRPSIHPLEAEAGDSWIWVAPPSPSSSPSAAAGTSPFTQRFAGNVDKLMIVAHPDDESLFGFLDLAAAQHERDVWIREQLQRRNNSSTLSASPHANVDPAPPGWKVVVVTNSFTPNRLSELSAALSALGVQHWECLSHLDSLTPRLLLDSRLVLSLADLIYSRPWSQIVTHGLDGEYGHYQHRLLSRVVHSLVFNPPTEHWPRSDSESKEPDSKPEMHPAFDSPHNVWKHHRIKQLREEESSSAQPAITHPSQRFPFESALHVFASYRDHQRYQARAEAYQSYLDKKKQIRDSPNPGAPSSEDAPGSLASLLREVDAQAQSLGALPPLPPSMSDALFARKLDHLERLYPSQWLNLQRFHQLSIQFSDLSLPAHRVFQSIQLRRAIYAELDERAMHTGDPALVSAWNRRSDDELWSWKDHSCEA